MWYKLKRILIYPDGVTEKQVYPWEITETYTYSWWSWITQQKFYSIAKSWFKVTSINITGSWWPISSSVYNTLVDVSINKDNSRTYQEVMFALNLGTWNTWTFSWIRVRENSSTLIDSYQISSSHINYTSSNSYTIEYTRTWYNFTINWHQYSWTYTTSAKSVFDAILDSSTINFRMDTSANTNATIGTQTVTVTYKPN